MPPIDTLSSETLRIDFPPSQIAAMHTVISFLHSDGFGLGKGYGFIGLGTTMRRFGFGGYGLRKRLRI